MICNGFIQNGSTRQAFLKIRHIFHHLQENHEKLVPKSMILLLVIS